MAYFQAPVGAVHREPRKKLLGILDAPFVIRQHDVAFWLSCKESQADTLSAFGELRGELETNVQLFCAPLLPQLPRFWDSYGGFAVFPFGPSPEPGVWFRLAVCRPSRWMPSESSESEVRNKALAALKEHGVKITSICGDVQAEVFPSRVSGIRPGRFVWGAEKGVMGDGRGPSRRHRWRRCWLGKDELFGRGGGLQRTDEGSFGRGFCTKRKRQVKRSG